MIATWNEQKAAARVALIRFATGFRQSLQGAWQGVRTTVISFRARKNKALPAPVPTPAPDDPSVEPLAGGPSMDPPAEPAAKAPAPAPLNRFLRSRNGHRYVIATSRATGGFGKYRFAVDDQGVAWGLREMQHAGHAEVTALRTLSTRFTIHDEIEQNERYAVVVPLMSGELPDAVARLREPSVRKALARSVVMQFAEDLAVCHERDHVHRDVKLASALWHSDGRIVIAEFASAKAKEDGKVQGACGTSGYMAPEVLFEQAYSEKADIWSLAMAFTAIHDNRLQRLLALVPRNPDILVSFSKWRYEVMQQPKWVTKLQPSRGRWDEYFAQLAQYDAEMTQFIVERMLEPRTNKRADAAEVQRHVRRLQPAGTGPERELLRALDSLAATDAKREACLTTLRAQV